MDDENNVDDVPADAIILIRGISMKNETNIITDVFGFILIIVKMMVRVDG